MNGYSSDSDSEMEEENNVPPRGLDPEFCKRIQNMKWRLYQIIILSPELDTPNAQNNELIQMYVNQLEDLYRFLDNAQRVGVVEKDLIKFPSELRSENLSMAEWIKKYFKQNGPADTLPYRDYLNTTLRVYPFVHHSRMISEHTIDEE
jgi:hypothetical protein